MPTKSGRVDRRSRLRSNRELSLIANSPGWVAATEKRLSTRGRRKEDVADLANSPEWVAATEKLLETPRNVSRGRGRRTSILPESYRAPRTRRQTIAPSSFIVPCTVSLSKNLDAYSNLLQPSTASTQGAKTRKHLSTLNGDPIIRSTREGTSAKQEDTASENDDDTSKSTSRKRTSKTASRRPKRSSPAVKKDNNKKRKRTVIEESDDSQSSHSDENAGEKCLTQYPIVRGGKVRKSDKKVIEEGTDILQTSVAESSFTGSVGEESGSRCLIL